MTTTGWTLLGALAITAFVGVRGEFPLSDDAAYAYAAHGLCTTGTLRFLPWTAATLVLQAAYGAALCKAFGFSFAVLRASTIALAIGGVVGFAQLLRQRNVRGPSLAFATAVFALNPLYVNLSFTFMTDVPFTAFVVWATYAYARGISERRVGFIVGGAAAATAALLIRQQGILVPIAAACAVALATGEPYVERARRAAIALLPPIVVFVAVHVWLLRHGALPIGYETRIGHLADLSVTSVVNCGFRGFVYLGLFLAPLLLAARGGADRRIALACGAIASVAAVALYVHERALMFYLTNVLYDLGVGALTLRDTAFLGYDPPLHVGAALAVPLTIAAVGGASLLAAAWLTAARRREAATVFLSIEAALLFAATLLESRYYLDRHLLPVLPALIALVATTQLPRPTRAATALLALFAWYAVAGTHDYLAWNRARFAGLDALLAEGVAPAAIDGGFEFNAWHLAPALGTWPSDRDVRPHQPDTTRSWWWVVDDRYVASFHELPRYHVRATLPFTRWLVPGSGRVLILERD